MNERPSVIVEADWDTLNPAQQECLRAVARATLGWGYRWGEEFRARFFVGTEHPDRLPAGVAMYNEPDRILPARGDIVVCFRSAEGDAHLGDVRRARATGALVIAESDPLVAEKFGDAVPLFTSPRDLVEKIFLSADPPELGRPVISIVIFTYNGSRFLGEAIASALDQDYPNYEVLVVDDGSTDETEALVRSIDSPRLRYVRQEHRGAPAARNRGIAEASGEFIVWLGSDDVLERHCLASHAGVLALHPEADVVYGNLLLCDGALNEQRVLRYEDWRGRNAELPAAMVRANVIPDGGTLVRKACYRRFGPYNEEFRRAHDYEWWSRLLSDASFAYNDTTVYRWRWHGANLGAGSGKPVDTSYEARIVRGLLKRYTPGDLFPAAGTPPAGRKHADAMAHVKAAEILAGYGDREGAACQLEEEEKLFPLPETRNAIRSLRERRLSVTYLITNILGVTGGNQTLLRQANALADRGHSVSIVTRSAPPGWCEIRPRVIQVPGNEPMARHVPPSDVVISTYFLNTHELVSVDAPVKVYFAQGDQFVFEDGCPSGKPDVRKLHAKMKELSRMSYRIPGIRFIANSRTLASRVERACGRKADGFLPVCVDQSIFKPLGKTPPGGVPRILVVGPDGTGTDIEPLAFKGIGDIREALETLRNGGEQFSLVRISPTPRSIFQGFACEFHVAPPDDVKQKLFGTADILLYASHYDSCPRPPLEAMAAGAAVVCTATEGAKEYCRDGENALLVPVRAPAEIAGAVRRLLHEEGLRGRIAGGGMDTARRFPREREWDELERMLVGYTHKEIHMENQSAAVQPKATDDLVRSMERAKELMVKGDVAGALEAASGAEQRALPGDCSPATRCALKNFLGLCHLGLGDLDRAKQSFSEALEIDNSSSRACTGLGDVLRIGGVPEHARTMYEWALKNDPANENAKQGLAALPPREKIEDITAVRTDSAFARAVKDLFARIRPVKLLETGTFIGNGTTTVIASALRDLAIGGARFYSIEVNPGLHAIAGRNIANAGLAPFVKLLNGLSVPRALLPAKEDIEERTVTNIGSEPIYVDHAPGERVGKYFAETDFPDVAEDLIGWVLSVFASKPDFVLLDSGGHMGFVEFSYLVSRLKGECYIALDDIFHVKHHRSFQQMSTDSRFEIITSVKEKAGFCIARFTPVPATPFVHAAPAQPGSGRARPEREIMERLAVAGEQFRKKEFHGALQSLVFVDGILSGIPASAPLEEAAAGVETVRGMSYLGLNDLENAKSAFEKALKIQPASSQACAGLGEVFYLAGLDSEAKVMFEHAVALGENNIFGRAGLAKSNKALGLPVGHSNLAAEQGRGDSAL